LVLLGETYLLGATTLILVYLLLYRYLCATAPIYSNIAL